MLFIGTITRLIEGDRYKHSHKPAAHPVPVGVSLPPRHARCSCRDGILCSGGSTHSRDVRIVAPVVAAVPVLSHHDARREWRYERRAMRDFHRAAKHGYGYRQPITVPSATIHGTRQRSYSPGDYDEGSSASRALPDPRGEHWEDDYPAARAAFGESRIHKVQRQAPPPSYETGLTETR
ncbi:hypothetical protein KVR01_007043 [Diaporthe batatas]|uniref:uncharacterized protein n=1 Tax=Diaporthe batatas TaxID=748121 RepID=UPI001D04D2A5|nr:uncharacterized protein KVR01_007043 [Diaporthe batatas]KAG8163746.1 hypothetical protein KVR01_007043 [Diaporthe batatas]